MLGPLEPSGYRLSPCHHFSLFLLCLVLAYIVLLFVHLTHSFSQESQHTSKLHLRTAINSLLQLGFLFPIKASKLCCPVWLSIEYLRRRRDVFLSLQIPGIHLCEHSCSHRSSLQNVGAPITLKYHTRLHSHRNITIIMDDKEKSPKERAEELKILANEAFKAHKFSQAIDLYTQAIELNPHNVVYWSNRAIAHTKLEEYGSALQDATKAIEVDPRYSKGYYRRGAAYLAMGKFKEALKDFQQVKRLRPNDPDANQKLKECEKAVQKIRFEEAIATCDSEKRSIADSIDFRSIEVDSSYTGARIEGEVVTLDFVEKLIEDFKNQKCLHKRYAFQIVLQAREMLRAMPSLVDVTIPNGNHFTVCGDIHGQFYDLLNIFELNGLPSEDNPYLFNGDFVDRGSFSLECILTLFAFKCMSPSAIYLSRGNHESKGMNKIYGFEGEVRSKLSETFVELFAEVFCCLPLAHVLNNKVFVVHGGLFSVDGVKLSDIRGIDRFCEPPEEGLMCELLWSDPQPQPGRGPSKRGVGLSFGGDVTKRFLKENNLDLVVRSHEVKDEGYEIEHDGKLITVFSAPNYCDQMGNKGAYIRFKAPEMKPEIVSFSAVPHPDVKPMAYANNFLRMFS